MIITVCLVSITALIAATAYYYLKSTTRSPVPIRLEQNPHTNKQRLRH